MTFRSKAFLAAILSVPCCRSSTDQGRCSGPFEITVDQTAGPKFSWTPADCPVYDLAVLESNTIKWTVFTTARANSLTTPVTYGQLPGPAFTASQADVLFTGIPYIVQLTHFTSQGRQVIVGKQSFVKAAN